MGAELLEAQDEAIQKNTGDIAGQIQQLVIKSPEDYQAGATLGKELMTVKKRIVATFKPIKSSAKQTHQEICDTEKNFLKKLETPEEMLRGKMETYSDEQERLREEQLAKERKVREDALAKEELLKKEAAEKAAQETARLKKEEEDRRLARAQELQESGQAAEADKLLEAPSNVQEVEPDPVLPQVPVISEEPLVKKAEATGVSMRKRWHAEVTDFKALVKAVADGKAPLACLGYDKAALNRMAVTLKESMDIPGVRAISESESAFR